MPVETEAKMKVDSHTGVREKLTALGGKPVGKFIEKNLFFDTDDRTLLTADKGLRIRRSTNLESKESSSIITFKGPRRHGPLKSREETEVEVTNFDEGAALLERLGYMRVLNFEKKRESWTLGNCKVELDELPHLGLYVEIEGPNDETVLKVRETLQLGDRPMVRASYIAMLMSYLQERGDVGKEIVFK